MKSETSKISSGNVVMDIRLAILKTIALVWSDDNCTHNKKNYRDILEKNTCKANNQWLEHNVKYNTPFENFGLKFLKPTGRWDFFGDHQWTKHQDEILEITLPILPKPPENREWSEFEKTEALIDYYAHFPTFFGPEKQQLLSDDDYNSYGNDYDLGISEDVFLSFSAALIKLIAAAWNNHKLLDVLDYDHRVKKASPEISTINEEDYFKEMSRVFAEYFHYECPWKFNLKFILPKTEESFWIPKNTQSVPESISEYRWNPAPCIRNALYIELPYSPDGKKQNVSLALARYNAIGPAYPFTCS